MGLFKKSGAEAVGCGETTERDRKQARHVGAGLLHGHAGLEPGKRFVAKVAKLGLAAIPLEGDDQRGVVVVEEVKVPGQDADDLPGLAIHGNGVSDHAGCAAEGKC